MKQVKSYKDEIDKAIRKISLKKWGTSYHETYKELYKNKEYKDLWKAIYTQVKGYIEVSPELSPQEAVAAFRRSRYYISQVDFYRNAIYDELKALGVNKGAGGRFISFKKENIQYHGYVTIEGKKYQKYSFKAGDQELFYYKDHSPRDASYEPWITEANYA